MMTTDNALGGLHKGVSINDVLTTLGFFKPLPSSVYTLRRPVMGEVLSTRIWGVPPAGGLLL